MRPTEQRTVMLTIQVASSFLIELGNGDKFIWDMGTGSYVNLIATGVPAAKLTKVGASAKVPSGPGPAC